MARSVPDDDMMEAQQALDLGHATRSAQRAATRASGTLIPPEREMEMRRALERAAYTPKHWRSGLKRQ